MNTNEPTHGHRHRGVGVALASAASLLLNLEGVFTALIAWYVFRENFDRRIALGMLAILAGGAVLSWEGRLAWGGIGGPALVAGACLAWAVWPSRALRSRRAHGPRRVAAHQ